MRIYEKVNNYIKNNKLSSDKIAKMSDIPAKESAGAKGENYGT